MEGVDDKSDSAPPDGGYGWITCFTGFMCCFVVDSIAFGYSILFSSLVDHL